MQDPVLILGASGTLGGAIARRLAAVWPPSGRRLAADGPLLLHGPTGKAALAEWRMGGDSARFEARPAVAMRESGPKGRPRDCGEGEKVPDYAMPDADHPRRRRTDQS